MNKKKNNRLHENLMNVNHITIFKWNGLESETGDEPGDV